MYELNDTQEAIDNVTAANVKWKGLLYKMQHAFLIRNMLLM